jgi:hypothetical protein
LCAQDGNGYVDFEEFLAYYRSVIYDADDNTFETGLAMFENMIIDVEYEEDMYNGNDEWEQL